MNQADLQMTAKYHHLQSSPVTNQKPASTGYAAHSTMQTAKTGKEASSPTHHRTKIKGCPWLKRTESPNGEQTTCGRTTKISHTSTLSSKKPTAKQAKQ